MTNELAKCAALFHMANDQNQRLQSFALREPEARELARLIHPMFCTLPPHPPSADDLYTEMINNQVTLWGVPIRVVQ